MEKEAVMAKNFELRKVWGIGPFKRRKVLSSFESLYIAEHVMAVKILSAKRRGKKLVLEIIDKSSGAVVSRKASK